MEEKILQELIEINKELQDIRSILEPKTQTSKIIIDNQIEILQLAQQKCLDKELFDYIGPIAKSITDIIVQTKW